MSSGTVTCLCGAIEILVDKAHPSTELCHCNPCRYTSGALFAGWWILNEAPDSNSLSKCTVYQNSQTHDRYFCSTCGTKLFVHAHHSSDGSATDRWHAFGGAIDPSPGLDNVLTVESNCWLADTKDGGMAPIMSKLDGRPIPCYNTDQHSAEFSTTDLHGMVQDAASQPLPSPNDTLKAECRCGGISLFIQRADHADRSISQLDRFIAKDAAGNATNKHMAFCCVCRYCRLQSGVSLTPWMYVPPVQVLNAHTGQTVAQHHEAGTPAGKEANTGLALKHYWSSEDACRSFCSTCGASVFYSNTRRQEIVNVAPGLLRAEEGVMARRWLSWQWGRTAWKDETTQKDLTDAWRATANA